MNAAKQLLRRSAVTSLLGLRYSIGLILLIAGILKIADPIGFHADLLAYEIDLPDGVARLIAVAFPCLEVICGLGLIIGFWRESVGILVVAITLIFVLMLGQALLRGLDLTCGCFGPAPSRWFNNPAVAFVRACVLLGAASWLHWQTTTNPPR